MTDSEPPQAKPLDWRYVAYNAGLTLLLPAALAYGGIRLASGRFDTQELRERWGLVPPEAAALASHRDPVVWFHACSVGEVAAVAPVIRALREYEPLAHVVLSTTTDTGREMARSRGLELDALVYVPIDVPAAVRRALQAVRPDALVMVDTELWPNILARARSMGIHTAVINGRISDRAYPRDRMIRPILAWTLSNVERVLTQSERDSERFLALGATAEQVEVMGNAKFDEEMPVVSGAESEKLRRDLALLPDAPLLVAGSTREGEEELILEAFDTLRHEVYDAQLVIAPRHPERGDAVERLVTERGWAAFRRSRALAEATDTPPPPVSGSQVRVVILDTIGELTRVYSLATVAFVGGSLVPLGGHNILQPIALGKPTVMGPHTQSQRDMVDVALREQAALVVKDAAELAEVTARIIQSEGEQQLFAARGRAMLDRHRGAARRYARAVVDLVRGDEVQRDVPV